MGHSGATPQLPKIVALSLLLYRLLLNLGPASFRRVYGKPALQDFRLCCRVAYQRQGSLGVLRLWPRLLGETVSGLLAEYWIELFGRKRPLLPTIQRSMVATFGAFVLFLLAYPAFGRTVDPVAPFDAVSRFHPEVALTHALVADGGEIALLALVLGGLPILFTAVKQAIPGGPRSVIKLFLIKPKQALFLLGAAPIIAVCSLGFLLATQYIFGLAMATTTVAASIWTIRLWVDAPQFSASGSGLGDGQTVWIIAFIAAMAVSTIVTVGAFTRGLRASA